MRDVGGNQDAINVVMNRYWGPDHRPVSTTVEIVRQPPSQLDNAVSTWSRGNIVHISREVKEHHDQQPD